MFSSMLTVLGLLLRDTERFVVKQSAAAAEQVPGQNVRFSGADLPGGEDSERCSPTLEFRSW